jgi:hypothetical protein
LISIALVSLYGAGFVWEGPRSNRSDVESSVLNGTRPWIERAY